MSLVWEQVVIEAQDTAKLGSWWAEALSWVVVEDNPAEFEIRSTPDQVPGIMFLQSESLKRAKNRLHLDFRPDDRDAEVERLLELGASRIHIGQNEDVPWVVLADPEGNEFCVLGGPH